MKLKNVLIVVSDMERSKRFYRDLFGLPVILEQEGNVILAEGLVLQEKQVWEKAIGKTVQIGDAGTELYFEEADMEIFQKKLNNYQEDVCEIRFLQSGSDEDLIRLYDPDGHLIEVRKKNARHGC